LQIFLNREAGIRRALPGLARQVVDGLLHTPPQLFVGLLQVEPILLALEADPAYHAVRRSG
jgi:hypothetical protein